MVAPSFWPPIFKNSEITPSSISTVTPVPSFPCKMSEFLLFSLSAVHGFPCRGGSLLSVRSSALARPISLLRSHCVSGTLWALRKCSVQNTVLITSAVLEKDVAHRHISSSGARGIHEECSSVGLGPALLHSQHGLMSQQTPHPTLGVGRRESLSLSTQVPSLFLNLFHSLNQFLFVFLQYFVEFRDNKT